MTRTKDNFHEMRQRERDEQYTNDRAQLPGVETAPATDLMLTPKKLQELNKEGIVDLAKGIVQGVQDGDDDAMDTLIMGKKIELLGKSIADNVKGHAYGKTYATKGNPYLRFGVKVEASELGVEYDYGVCNDRQLDFLQWEADKSKANLDARKKMLQTLPEPMELVDKDTGETYEIRRAVKKSLLGYKINL